MTSSSLVVTLTLMLLAGASFALVLRTRRREERDERILEDSIEKNLHVPQSLHPVVDADACIGSFSCLTSCPEGDILGIVENKARLVRGSNCIGHGKCALECPVGAIKLVIGTSERGVDLPEVDEHFESSRPGVHVVGELGGMGLIRNAFLQGMEVADVFKARLRGRPAAARAGGAVDVAIVGAGPAGLATALGCRAHGLTYRVLEQESVGGTIATYPRHKLVMTETVRLPIWGKFGKRLILKEELLDTLQKVIEKAGLRIEEKVKVSTIEGKDGDFTLATSAGPVRARKVVLATGRRGSPRKLGVPGEDLPHVTYRLIDAEQYAGKRVLVVGGGDSALEAAIQLCEQPGTTVTLSYRGEALGKCREANRQKVGALVAAKRLRSLMPSVVQEIRAGQVRLKAGAKEGWLPVDYVIVSIGGELPLEFLKAAGVGMRRYHGEELGSPAPARPAAKPGAAAAPPRPAARRRDEEEERKDRRLAYTLFGVGAFVLAVLAAVGWDYYLLPRGERRLHALHAALRPSGPWGHGVGIVATGFMLSNFLYPVRKRWGWLKGSAPIRRWLTFHIFVGLMSPAVIGFHAAFQTKNVLATATAVALALVVLTGVLGRFIYGLVPSHEGRVLELNELSERQEKLKEKIVPLLGGMGQREAVEALLTEVSTPPGRGQTLALLLRAPWDALRRRVELWSLRSHFPSRQSYRAFAAGVQRLGVLRLQVAFYRSFKRLLSVWRVLHIVLAIFLVVVIAAHIALCYHLGYGIKLS